MGVVENLTERNAEFAKSRFNPDLRMRPALAAIVIWCADTRVDPAVVLGAEQGESWRSVTSAGATAAPGGGPASVGSQ